MPRLPDQDERLLQKLHELCAISALMFKRATWSNEGKMESDLKRCGNILIECEQAWEERKVSNGKQG